MAKENQNTMYLWKNKIINGTNRLFDDNNNHVEFYATGTHFSVVIYNANYENGTINGTINDNEELVYMLMKKNAKITVIEIIENTNIPRRTINRIITRLKEKELIVREGSNKDGYWKIVKQ